MADPKRPNLKISVDDLFTGGGQLPIEKLHGQIVQLDISELHDFKNHPFKVRDDEAMRQMAESIRDKGILNPILVRPRQEGGYEVIAGHRRKFASELAGVDKLPAIIKEYDNDEATILMVDSNIQRENILPSERAFAFKMKLDAMNRQSGRPSKENVGQVVPHFKGKRSTEIIGNQAGESYKQVQRFIRLTNLIPELLDMVDEKRIAFSPAVELSFLKEAEQRDLFSFFETEEATPSLSQAQRLKQFSQSGKLDDGAMLAIMTEEKANQKEVFKFKPDDLAPHIHKSIKPEGYRDFVIKACDHYTKYLERNRSKDARINTWWD